MKERNYVLTDYELDIVMKALMEQPYKVVGGLIPKLINQANAQGDQDGSGRSTTSVGNGEPGYDSGVGSTGGTAGAGGSTGSVGSAA